MHIYRKIENFSPIGISMIEIELAYLLTELKRQKHFLLEDIEKRMNFYISQAEYIEELIRREKES